MRRRKSGGPDWKPSPPGDPVESRGSQHNALWESCQAHLPKVNQKIPQILVILVLVLLLSPAGYGLNVGKLSVHCQGSGLYSITVKNNSETTESYIFSKISWLRNEFGRNLWNEVGDERHKSCVDWITLKLERFSLDGGESRKVFFSIDIPRRLATQHWAGLVITSQPTGKGMSILSRYIVKIFAEPHKPVESGEITKMSHKDGQLSFSFQNTGTIQLKCQYSVGEVEGVFFVLPGYSYAAVKKVEIQEKKVEVVINYGSGKKGGRLWLK